MEQNYGGPVWHASACDHSPLALTIDKNPVLEKAARKALQGVGERSLGEWVEYNTRFVHVRRRLSVKEQKIIGEVIDIRNTQEAIDRVNAIWQDIPLIVKRTIMQDGPF